MSFADERAITFADLPGIVESGAVAGAEGRSGGAGQRMLRHAERARLLLVLVDLFGFQLRAASSSGARLTPFYCALDSLALLNRVRTPHVRTHLRVPVECRLCSAPHYARELEDEESALRVHTLSADTLDLETTRSGLLLVIHCS